MTYTKWQAIYELEIIGPLNSEKTKKWMNTVIAETKTRYRTFDHLQRRR